MKSLGTRHWDHCYFPEVCGSYLKELSDDTKIKRELRTIQVCVNLQEDLDEVQQCSKKWNMKLNPNMFSHESEND